MAACAGDMPIRHGGPADRHWRVNRRAPTIGSHGPEQAAEGERVTTYDYLIVGGGTAGCVLAARLSEDPDVEVLLIESGPALGPPEMYVSAGFPELWRDGGTPEIKWSRWTTPQPGTMSRTHCWSAGRVLGGSSSVNAMMHVRGHRAVYDRWAEGGAKGWGHDDLVPYFRRTETAIGRDPGLRGVLGPVWAAPTTEVDDGSLVFLEAVRQAGYDLTADISGAGGDGAFWCDLTVLGGRRQSAADAYLIPALGRPNLHLVTDAHVSRLLIDRDRCVAVEYRSFGNTERAHSRREVILAAGTVGSAQLLLLSGVGPAEHLREAGIPVCVDLPGVGANLHDHLQCRVDYDAERQLTAGPGFGAVGALVHSGSSVAPDIQLMLIDRPDGGFRIAFAHTAPASRGTVRLDVLDPQRPPVIDPHYLGLRGDVLALRAGLEIAREVAHMPAFREVKAREADPGVGHRPVTYIRERATTFFNPVGACRIGLDDLAVVDTDLKVRGVEGLRVADASVMPTVPNTGLNATVLAIAERAAEAVRQST
jgi:choline dehydrogenase